jgi:hypothetical protein
VISLVKVDVLKTGLRMTYVYGRKFMVLASGDLAARLPHFIISNSTNSEQTSRSAHANTFAILAWFTIEIVHFL